MTDFQSWVDARCVAVPSAQAAPVATLFNDFSLWSLEHRDLPLITRGTFLACLQMVRHELFNRREPGGPSASASRSLPGEARPALTPEQWLLNSLAYGPRGVVSTDITSRSKTLPGAPRRWLMISDLMGLPSSIAGHRKATHRRTLRTKTACSGQQSIYGLS